MWWSPWGTPNALTLLLAPWIIQSMFIQYTASCVRTVRVTCTHYYKCYNVAMMLSYFHANKKDQFTLTQWTRTYRSSWVIKSMDYNDPIFWGLITTTISVGLISCSLHSICSTISDAFHSHLCFQGHRNCVLSCLCKCSPLCENHIPTKVISWNIPTIVHVSKQSLILIGCMLPGVYVNLKRLFKTVIKYPSRMLGNFNRSISKKMSIATTKLSCRAYTCA